MVEGEDINYKADSEVQYRLVLCKVTYKVRFLFPPRGPAGREDVL